MLLTKHLNVIFSERMFQRYGGFFSIYGSLGIDDVAWVIKCLDLLYPLQLGNYSKQYIKARKKFPEN